MPITPEQATQIKKQLFTQIKNFPEERRIQAESYIENLNEQELEEFLIQNNLIKLDKEGNTPENYTPSKCIFCSIISEEIPSTKIDENKEAIAIFEINPISKAHALIIPKYHVKSENEIPEATEKLAKKVYKKLLSKFSPKGIIQANSNVMGHEIINLIPVYDKESLDSPRARTTPEALQELLKEYKKKAPKKPRAKKEKSEIPKKSSKKDKSTKITSENTWLPVRIP